MLFEDENLKTDSVFAVAAARKLRLGLGPPVRGREGHAAAAAAAAGDDWIAMRVTGDLGGRAAAYRMPVYSLIGAVVDAASTAESEAATASACDVGRSGLWLITLETFLRDSISARMRSCSKGG
jgi:hypothetical protein